MNVEFGVLWSYCTKISFRPQ